MYIRKIHNLITKKTISCVELTKIYLERINSIDNGVQSFLEVTKEQALMVAKKVDERVANKEEIGILEGIPINLKDNICTKDIKTTAASKMLENYIPPFSATAYDMLSKSPLLGKVNLDEFAMGTSTETSAFKKTKNPWDLTKVPGGSSGGSVASIAAELSVFSLGSDTGGSIRQPAAFCGVVGLKPTYGIVSRFGTFALASSLDQVGPVTKTVEDCAIVLNAIQGKDPKDATSVDINTNYLDSIQEDIKGLRIGIPKEMLPKETEADVYRSFQNAMEKLEELGVKLVEIDLPHIQYGVNIYSILAYAEAASNLARLDGIRYGDMSRSEGLGDEVKRRIMLGTYFLKGENYRKYYLRAQRIKQLITQDFNRAFEKCHCIASPTTLSTAFDIGKKLEPHIMQLNDLLTIPANLAGIPALSLPCGFDKNGLPIGLQLMGNSFSEDVLFRIGHSFQMHTDYHLKRPNILKGVVDYGI